MPLLNNLTKALGQAEQLASVLKTMDKTLDGGRRHVGGGTAVGGGSLMGGSMASFSGGTGGGGGMAGPSFGYSGGSGTLGSTLALAQNAMGWLPGVTTGLNFLGAAANVQLAGMPGADAMAARQARFYGASFRTGNSMAGVRNALGTFSSTGGMQYAGQDAVLAQQMAVYGINPAGRFGQQALATAGNASALMNLNPEDVANSVLGMSSGAGSANMMRQLGIYTSDPSTGEQLSPQQIAEQLKSRLYTGRAPLTAEEVNNSFYRGNLGASLRGLGLDETMQDMIRQSLIGDANGKPLDLSDTAGVRRIAGSMPDQNPNLVYNRMATAESGLMDASTEAYTASLQEAATMTEEYVKRMRWAVENVPYADAPMRFGYRDAALGMSAGGRGAQAATQGVLDAGSSILGAVGSVPLVGPLLQAGLGTALTIGAGLVGMGMGDDANRVGGGTRTASAAADGQSGWAMPTPGPVTSQFGPRIHPITGEHRNHNGTDIGAPEGTPIQAIADGVVDTVADTGSSGYGKYVRIDHQNGYRSLYAHMSATSTTKGAKVKKGQVIGKVGSTGSSTAPHLHIEVTRDGAFVDPMSVLSGAQGIPAPTDGTGAPADSSGGKPSMTANGMPTTKGLQGGSGLLPINQDLLSLVQENNVPTGSLNFMSREQYSGQGGGENRLGVGTRTGGRRQASTYMPGMPRAKQGDSYVAQDGPINVHAGEAILNLDEAEEWRASRRGGGKKSGTNVTIHVNVQQASESEARRLASMVRDFIHEDDAIARMGGQ
jgi:murein DD-endopeptidase MepM/ murein hydrolase activator NlpD